MLRRLATNKKALVIVPVVLALVLAGLFLPVRKVSIEPYGMLSLESKIAISVGYEAAYANPAAPLYVEFTEAKASSNVLSIQISKPVTVAGDLLVAGMTTDGGTSLTPPAGWTEISQGSSGGKVTSGSWWKIASSSEPANYTFQVSASEMIYIFILRITGAHATAPIDVSAFAPGESINPTCPNVTTTVAGTLVLRLFGADECEITVDAGYPTNHTGITVDESGGSQPASGGAARKEQVLAGDTTTASFTLTAAEEWYATTIAIKPPVPDISNTPTSKDFGNVTTSTSYWSTVTNPPTWSLDDSECFFEVTNNSGAPANIAIRATNFDGGGGWVLTTGTPGVNTVRLKAGASGTTDENAMVILENNNKPFISNLGYVAGSNTKRWELKMETPSSFGGDYVPKTATITLTATLF